MNEDAMKFLDVVSQLVQINSILGIKPSTEEFNWDNDYKLL